MSQQQYDDPFAVREKTPSLKFPTIGTTYTGRVLARPELVQSRDFETGERQTWDDGNPKMSVVTTLDVNGERMSLWAPKPSAMFVAIAEAQQQAGQQITLGGILTITYIGDKPNEKNPRLNPVKQYSVRYQPPGAFDAPPPSSSAHDGEPPF